MTDQARPLVSVVVPVYRHQPYLEPALQSILALSYDPLEIIIQDDASPDDAFDVIKRVVDAYGGPHTIKIGKNAKNLSMTNFNVLMEKATGDYVVAAHDDDIQNPDRISQIMDAFLSQDVSMVSSNAVRIAASGEVICNDTKATRDRRIDAEEFAATGWSPHVYGAALSWHRDVFDQFGPIDIDGTARASDWIIPYRASLLKGIHYLHTPTLSRRVHRNSRGAIGRNTDDQEMFVVETHSEQVSQLIYMLNTTQDAVTRGLVDAGKAARLSASIQDLIVKSCRSIAVARNRLHMRKRRATWIDHDEGPVAQSDVPNLGVIGDEMEALTSEGLISTLPKKLSSRRKIVKAVQGAPWYWVALKNPLGIRYWWAVRRLQHQFRGANTDASLDGN